MSRIRVKAIDGAEDGLAAMIAGADDLGSVERAATALTSTQLKRGIRSAGRYCELAGRTQVSNIDVQMCVRYEILDELVYHRNDGRRKRAFLRDVRKTYDELFGHEGDEDEEVEDADEDADEEDDEEADEGEEEDEEDEEEEEEWHAAPETDHWVRRVHQAQHDWISWEPTERTERLLKETLEKVYQKTRDDE